MSTTTTPAQNLYEVYKAKGLNSLYAYAKSNGIKISKVVFEHGLHTNKEAKAAKYEFEAIPVEENKLFLHYHSRSVNAKNGYTYNVLRSIRITVKAV